MSRLLHAQLRFARARTRALRPARWLFAGSALWLALVNGCIDGIVIDEQRGAATVSDAEVTREEDADLPEPDPEPMPDPPTDAGQPPPPPLDAGMEPAPKPDAGHDAGRDSGPPPVQDAGGKPDAGCTSARCDAGAPTPPGPCASCGGVMVLVQPVGFDAVCENGAESVCWTNPYGECTVQCPKTDSCTKDNLTSCGAGRFCYFPKSDCGTSSAGFCASVPVAKDCANISAPVCGCDGAVYQSTCFAAAAGSAVHSGLPMDNCK
jgi:hypothetical protein